jgi:hypothetical protein
LDLTVAMCVNNTSPTRNSCPTNFCPNVGYFVSMYQTRIFVQSVMVGPVQSASVVFASVVLHKDYVHLNVMIQFVMVVLIDVATTV